jgi:hypothetical protein
MKDGDHEEQILTIFGFIKAVALVIIDGISEYMQVLKA